MVGIFIGIHCIACWFSCKKKQHPKMAGFGFIFFAEMRDPTCFVFFIFFFVFFFVL